MEAFGTFLPLILIFVVFYFLLIRPQQRKVKQHKEMLSNLKRGDKIVTSGGIIGTVDRVLEDDRVELNISDGVKVQVIKNTIQGLLKKRREQLESKFHLALRIIISLVISLIGLSKDLPVNVFIVSANIFEFLISNLIATHLQFYNQSEIIFHL